jgi:hypothetical protein
MTVFVYVNTAKATSTTSRSLPRSKPSEIWFEENDPEGVAFEYDVIGSPA